MGAAYQPAGAQQQMVQQPAGAQHHPASTHHQLTDGQQANHQVGQAPNAVQPPVQHQIEENQQQLPQQTIVPTEQKSQGGQVFAIETRKVNTAPQNPTLDVPESSLRGANKKTKENHIVTDAAQKDIQLLLVLHFLVARFVLVIM